MSTATVPTQQETAFEGDQGHPGSWVWICAPDVEILVEELRAPGARIRHKPADYPWAIENTG